MNAPMSWLEILVWLVLCVGFIFLSALFNGAETGLYCINRLRLRVAAHTQQHNAARLQKLLTDQAGVLSTILLGNNLANYLAPFCLTMVFLGVLASPSEAERGRWAEFYTTAILAPLTFIVAEAVPKNVFQRRADTLMPRMAGLLQVTHWLFRLIGFIALQKRIAQYIATRFQQGSPPDSAFSSRHSLYQMLHEGAAAGALTHTQVSILDRLNVLQSVRVGSVMVPRIKTIMINAEMSATGINRFVRDVSVSRVPVYRDDPRHVIGVAHVLDLLTATPQTPITRYMHPVLAVQPEMTVIEALNTLQQQRRRMAIVIDKWGHCVGIVTLKDLVEEIVGELAAW